MKATTIMRCLGFFLLLLNIPFVHAQQVVHGVVVDSETETPVPFASIGIQGTSRGTSSNLEGEFTLAVEEPFAVKVTCVGYESQLIHSIEGLSRIRLKQTSTRLDEVVIFQKSVNPIRVVRRAFSNTDKNYQDNSFLQQFFYRHYCKDNTQYGRLIEAFVDVWKEDGYRQVRQSAGEKEYLRVTHLRRSMDRTSTAQGHEPISVGDILEADIVGYQVLEKRKQVSFYSNLHDLRTNPEQYDFTFKGATTYDGQEVYKIDYEHTADSVLTTSGYHLLPGSKGTLYITTDTYALIRATELRTDGDNTATSSVYYRQQEGKYYPYHFITEGTNKSSNGSTHWYHIELMSLDIRSQPTCSFSGWEHTREQLRSIAYDSVFWANSTILKSTPLEKTIIRDLGGGASLQQQFHLYNRYESNTTEGGTNGAEKLSWLLEYSHGRRPLYLCFWSGDVRSYVVELEYFKRLNSEFRESILFIMISTEDSEDRWRQHITQYNLASDGILHYRVKPSAPVFREFDVDSIPSFVLISKDGTETPDAKHPNEAGIRSVLLLMSEQ